MALQVIPKSRSHGGEATLGASAASERHSASYKGVFCFCNFAEDAGAYTSASKGSPSTPGGTEIQFNARDDKVICLSSAVMDALGKKAQALKVLDTQLGDFGWGEQLGLTLTKRTPGMLSCYDGKTVPDAQYGFHVDNPYLTNMGVPDDGRLTLVYYIADGPWDVEQAAADLPEKFRGREDLVLICRCASRIPEGLLAPLPRLKALTHDLFTVAPEGDTLVRPVVFFSHTMFLTFTCSYTLLTIRQLADIPKIGRDLSLHVSILKYEVVESGQEAQGIAKGLEVLKARVSLAKTGQHVEYILQVSMNSSSPWTLRRRFNDVAIMHEALRRRVPSLPELPSKSVRG
ncbi:AMY1A [Symbiodinium necroappetens]|uniref:AMY1A protein n=1 Tax=Symbiodinium necroappetens TaxID=1628268 RepID=A0A813CCV6_9DINO|nr:AMY1A [Symbiodinium necroappetens]